ncbi:MAG: hypothetical protein ABIY55_28480 [Kofleriaceae bacterium]
MKAPCLEVLLRILDAVRRTSGSHEEQAHLCHRLEYQLALAVGREGEARCRRVDVLDARGRQVDRLREPQRAGSLTDMVASERVQRILSDVRELDDEEKAQLETELLAEDADVGKSWGEEVDRRAARALAADVPGLRRDEVRSLFAMAPGDARARLAELLDARK